MRYSSDQIFFQRLLRIYAWLLERAYGSNFEKGDLKVMSNFVVKDNNPDIQFSTKVGDVFDEENHKIDDPQLSYEYEASGDPNVIIVTPGTGGQGNNLSFGDPGVASLTTKVSDPATGKLLGSGVDGFTVTTGDPNSVASVSNQFDGLTPVDEPSA